MDEQYFIPDNTDKTLLTPLEEKVEDMATRDGHQIGWYLVENRGWTWADEPEAVMFGDPWVIDPVTKNPMSPHDGKKVQDERDRQGPNDPTAEPD